jgi:cation diffusion facilitator family transporter
MKTEVKFGIVAILVIVFQSILKLIGVILTGSIALLSETVDTLTDIVFGGITLYSIIQSNKPPDFEHMYGHRKIDSLGSLVQGIILINLYIFLIINAIQAFINETYQLLNPGIGLIILIFSFSINIVFSRILIWQGNKTKLLSLKIQGLNLFQDSLRAIIVLVNLVIAIFFDILFLDPIFSVILSIWIIFGAIKLSKDGIENLLDTNPINQMIVEDLKQSIFQLEHVNGVEEIKVRGIADTLFIEVHLSVEDHISIAHANEVSKSIQTMVKEYFPNYDVETIIEMNPLGGEDSIGENIVNLLHSLHSEYPEIVDIKDLNVFRIENDYFLSFKVVVNEDLSLKEAHNRTTDLENELKLQSPQISRIISHIEAKSKRSNLHNDQLICVDIQDTEFQQINKKVEKILREHSFVKGYHGLEYWKAKNSCILEIHVFFDGSLNIAQVHKYVSDLEKDIIVNLEESNLEDVIIHSEPVQGRTDGKIFSE